MFAHSLDLCAVFLLFFHADLSLSQLLPSQTFFPPSIPLAVRSPYMSVWYASTNSSPPISTAYPSFWTAEENILSWVGRIRVDGVTYSWMGQDQPAPGCTWTWPTGNYLPPIAINLTTVRVTPTRSIFSMRAGPMNVTVTFLSPIEPSDLVLQSLPFSYVSMEAESLDGKAHDIQLYSDVNPQWLSNNWDDPAIWSTHQTGNSVYHQFELQSPQPFAEVNAQAQDGVAYIAMTSQTQGLTWEIDADETVRNRFSSQGTLANTSSGAFGPIRDEPTVFAISVDLGQVQATSAPVAWAVGFVRNPSISYTTSGGQTLLLSPYFTTKYGTDVSRLIDDFTAEFASAMQRAMALDQAILNAASKISPQYVDLVSLAARQTFSTIDITASFGSDGLANASDVRIFMKELGALTTYGRTNPVEELYAALPLLLYLNASLVGPMLSPLLDAPADLSGQAYAPQDLGQQYPFAIAASGPQSHPQGVEQTGNMLIMLYAHARFAGDGALIMRHYNLTRLWANYLVGNSLNTNNQESADGEQSANITNLALKGIIGVKAMAQIALALGEEADANQYNNQANTLIGQWRSLAMSSDQKRLLNAYGDQQSWTTLYNLYADKLLGTDLVDQSLVEIQADTLRGRMLDTFGVPIDSGSATTVNAAWLLFAAASMPSDVRDALIQHVWNRASYNKTFGAFPVVYDLTTGDVLEGTAGAGVGAMFSILALDLSPLNITVPPPVETYPATTASGSSHVFPVGAVVGPVVGAIGLVAVAVAVVIVRKRRRNRRTSPLAVSQEELGAGESRDRMRPTPFILPARSSLMRTNYPGNGPLQPNRYTDSVEDHAGLHLECDTLPAQISKRDRDRHRFHIDGGASAASGGVQAESAEPRTPPSGPASAGGSGSTTQGSTQNGSSTMSRSVAGLWVQVDHIRREMDELQRRRTRGGLNTETLPEYSED